MSLAVATLAGVQPLAGSASGTRQSHDLDAESRAWLADLRADGATREEARGALYKTVHDARRKLRTTLAAAGFELDAAHGGGS